MDFDKLIEQAKWRLPKKAKVDDLKESVQVELSDDFKKIFPKLSELISLATVKEFTANGEKYRFYEWKDINNESLVWFADMEIKPKEEDKNYINEVPVGADEILKEHLLLLSNIGGILETWNECEEEDFLTWAKNFVFSLKYSYRFADQQCLYNEEDGWIFDKVDQDKQLPVTDLICFSEEANGDLTFYNRKNALVYLLLHDHCFYYVEELDGHPEYSFYTIKGIHTFVEYAELLASQTLSCIKGN